MNTNIPKVGDLFAVYCDGGMYKTHVEDITPSGRLRLNGYPGTWYLPKHGGDYRPYGSPRKHGYASAEAWNHDYHDSELVRISGLMSLKRILHNLYFIQVSLNTGMPTEKDVKHALKASNELRSLVKAMKGYIAPTKNKTQHNNPNNLQSGVKNVYDRTQISPHHD